MFSLVTKDDIKNLFPSPSSGIVFLLYMAMFVAHGLLVTSSRDGSSQYKYNPTCVVLMTETIKLFISTAVYLYQNSFTSLLNDIKKNTRILMMYLVPSSLYCIYNNVSFISLVHFNPTTYFMFMQIRLLLTGLIYQILFKRQLSQTQWFSLALLTIGCMVHATGKGTTSGSTSDLEDSWWHLAVGVGLILTQVLCSVFAGVYNEYIIKGEGADVDIMIQNVFMYVDSILCNVVLLAAKGEILETFTGDAVSSLFQTIVIVLMINNAVLGIITSLFLKKLNSIVKAFASALELVFTALLSVPVLGIPLTYQTVIAILIISLSVIIYAKNPVKINESQTKESLKQNP